jgi:TolA-binding protein
MELIGQDEVLLGEAELRERVRELEGLCVQLRMQVAQMEKTVAQAQGERDRFQALYQRALAHAPRRSEHPQDHDPSAALDGSATLGGLGEAMAQRGEIVERAVARASRAASEGGSCEAGRLL